MSNAAAETPLDVEIQLSTEGSEFQRFVGDKLNQRRTWYVVERETGAVPAFHNRKRTDETCACLMRKPLDFTIIFYYTDNRKSCRKYIPAEKHIIGKNSTWKIERRSLNFRTHIKRLSRKTICFSKNEIIHDNVIGIYWPLLF